jgi:hypothetical protein
VKMSIIPIQHSYFDDKAVRAMGAAFDRACHFVSELRESQQSAGARRKANH